MTLSNPYVRLSIIFDPEPAISPPLDAAPAGARFRRVLRLRDLILYGIIIVQPTAPMPVFGVVSQEARGHVVTAILIAMTAMLFTAVSYGRMARVYPSAGSAYTYVTLALDARLGYLTGWSIVLDYLLNPIICAIWCAKAAGNLFAYVPYPVFAIGFALLFTMLNLRGIETSARVNQWLVAGMSVVVVVFFWYAAAYLLRHGPLTAGMLVKPFYDPQTFSWAHLSAGAAIATLTYIGFDGVSTLSEEVENPQRNIMLATVATCLITGVLASLQVYAGQLIWPDFQHYPDVDTAFVHVAGRAGGPFLFALINITLLVATVGSGFGSQLGAARLLYGMGRDNAIPKRFFGVLDAATAIPRNNILFSGALCVAGALTMSYQLGAELLNFGAFIAFMGVNAAAFVHYGGFRKWTWRYGLPPLLGVLVCGYIWLSLSVPAKTAGALWLAAGIGYGAWRGNLKRAVAVTNS